MITDQIAEIRSRKPLVLNITNYVTVNDCANILLAIGASPIMADDEQEVEELAALSQGLVINIGTLNRRTLRSMVLAGKKANELGVPVVLDPVGNGATRLRTEAANLLLKEVRCAVIRGNVSEIRMAYAGSGRTKGVDADDGEAIPLANLVRMARSFSAETGAVIAITGGKDIVSTADKSYVIANGHEKMARITGSGCMLTALVGAFCAAGCADLDRVVAAVAAMGLAGEIAAKECRGTGGFRALLLDAISNMDDKRLGEGIKVEEFKGGDEALSGHR
ncbi:MAG: hydroxyethylthiazole kinase [Deltaproteobacteria bacterium]|nr:hydroxyethylthiazole kinase [Deltaproteobacteria bacterium]